MDLLLHQLTVSGEGFGPMFETAGLDRQRWQLDN